MRMAYTNLIDPLAASCVTALTTLSGYPVTNLQDQRLSTKWISDTATTQTIIFDFGSTTGTVTVCALMGHVITSSAITTIAGDDTNTWTAGTTVETLTYNTGMIIKYFTGMTHRYWRLKLTGLDAAAQIGRVWLGDYIQIDPSSLDNFTVTKKRDDNVMHGRGRQKYASIGESWRQFDLSFPQTKGTTLTAIQTLHDTVGNHSSFVFCNFDTERSYPLVDPCYVSINDDVSFSHSGNQRYTYNLALEEEL
jgi:hypothetical protein